MTFVKGMLVGAALVGATMMITAAAQPSQFHTIDVQRINIREDDGTLRMVLAGRDAFPGAFEDGKEIARPDRRAFAGVLLLNDEGTENGGLIWKGSKDAEGKPSAGASLTFDRYHNDQTLQLLQTDEGTRDTSALILSDRPAVRFDWDKLREAEKVGDPQLQAKMLAEAGVGGATRLFVGRSRDRASVVSLRDAQGKPRLQLRVDAEGMARIEFLDAKGAVVRSLTPDDVAPR